MRLIQGKLMIRTSLLSLLGLSAAVAAPLQIQHQARLLDTNGEPISAGTTVVFRIYEAPSGGAALWTESHGVTPDAGYVAVALGSIEPLDDRLFTGATQYLSTQIGSAPESTDRMPILSVPYAIRAGALSTGGNGATPETASTTCKTLHAAYPDLDSGTYYIDPDGPGGEAPFLAYCDMVTDDGGWTLLLNYDHNDDLYAGAPNPLATDFNPTVPSITTTYSRDWRSFPESLIANNRSEILLRRHATADTKIFTVREWVGWDTPCMRWQPTCSFDESMSMYAVVEDPAFPHHDYYFHACDGVDCHGTNTYEAVGVDCHAWYTSNYAHTGGSTSRYNGTTQANCPSGRDPDLYGFGASQPSSARLGGWGSGNVNLDLGLVGFYLRE